MLTFKLEFTDSLYPKIDWKKMHKEKNIGGSVKLNETQRFVF